MKAVYAKQLVNEATRQMLIDLVGESHNGYRMARYISLDEYTKAYTCGANSREDLALLDKFDELRALMVEKIKDFRINNL